VGLSNIPTRFLKTPRRALLLTSLAVHGCILLVAVWRGGIDTYAFSSLDSGEYYRLALNVVEHGVFSQQTEIPLTPDTWRTPGYPLFLAAVMFLGGDSPAMLVVVQQFLSVFNTLLVFSVARRLIGPSRAIIVALLFLVEPYHSLYSLWLMPTTLIVTLLLAMWRVWQRLLSQFHWGGVIALGMLCGLAVLVRPVTILIPPAMFLSLAGTYWRREGRREGARDQFDKALYTLEPGLRKPGTRLAPVLFVLACAVVIGPWMWRNQKVAGHFALSHQGGIVLAYFKATEVILWREGRSEDRILETTLDPRMRSQPHAVWDEIDERLREKMPGLPSDVRDSLTWRNLAQGNRTQVDDFAVSRALTNVGWSYLSLEPFTTLVCCAIRCGSLLTFPLNLAVKPPTGVVRSRVGDLAVGLAYFAGLLWIAARLILRRVSLHLTFFPLLCVLALLVTTTPQLDPRFRVPMIPFLLFIALCPSRTVPRTDTPTFEFIGIQAPVDRAN